MRKLIQKMLLGAAAVFLLASSAFAAEIAPSTSSITLQSGETTCTFDISLHTTEAFAGAEFGIKPSNSDVALSMSFLDNVKNESLVRTEKNGVLYFGFFSGSNKYAARNYQVARITCTYAGTGTRTITLDSSSIVTIDGDGNTSSDTSSEAFTVTITRSASGTGEGGGGGGGGGGSVTPVQPSKPSVSDTPADLSFVDVSTDAYYYDAVLWAVEKGIANGTSATTFSPDLSCTRAQMVTFLWRAAGSPAPAATSCPFTDVQPDAYYYNAVLWAVEQGITAGTSETTFSPDLIVTRGQAVTFLWRQAGSPAVSTSGSFSDVPATAYYANAVKWAITEGVTVGTGNDQFSPASDCTRAQIVTLMYRNAQ